MLAQIHPQMAGYELLQSLRLQRCYGFDLAVNFLTDSSSFGDTGHCRLPKSQKNLLPVSCAKSPKAMGKCGKRRSEDNPETNHDEYIPSHFCLTSFFYNMNFF